MILAHCCFDKPRSDCFKFEKTSKKWGPAGDVQLIPEVLLREAEQRWAVDAVLQETGAEHMAGPASSQEGREMAGKWCHGRKWVPPRPCPKSPRPSAPSQCWTWSTVQDSMGAGMPLKRHGERRLPSGGNSHLGLTRRGATATT